MISPSAPSNAPAKPAPIIVAGMARSGTSWLGKVLSFAEDYTYYREPDNVNFVPGTKAYFENLYLADGMNDLAYAQHMDQALAGKVANHFTMSADPGPWLERLPPQFLRLGNVVPALYRRRSGVLLKLVYANLTLDWIAARYPHAHLIYIQRHPAAVFASWHRLGWDPDPQSLLRQEGLMAAHLEPYREVIERADSFWARAGALWGATHRVIENQIALGMRARILSFEEACENPEAVFRGIYESIGCAWDDRVADFLSTTNTLGDRSQTYSLKRDARTMINAWREEVDTSDTNECLDVISHFGLSHVPCGGSMQETSIGHRPEPQEK